ncbi:flagellar biosynthesis protein FlhA [Burkholderia thailandensis]|uniref:Flagellar biosynthesis protein FlhA n=1 Tax=Burkholderia thailandensis (strain ATCC 700388 / DSM 13276 / CCUG 48851 / CIP 106301 / E264) TaxID=271848 RepID=Q2T8Y4_BURTA|nr:flagellar biosynthesis protein FlhA [Burkholderia thailandensis]ABC34501.1 flagellar biosynthesis protein FlhA [Burkholderia thailandensis E264]AHI76282.1 flagellar biosynthesis protein FlhA [Burkholderia thailandensis 2002721723]AHI81427.1 flagellar biosynthesis protein FlhA [Burkholderia thailandensis E444]AIC90695.1 flagellar biosynthesis protein FlhA [Burkholderia thailandensis USAMRU Malaysia \
MNKLTHLFADLRQYQYATPLVLLAVLSMVILPLPPVILDLLFTFNIVLAIVVILVSVSVKRPLEFSVFPTIILTTTLMRLTLNVASTRVVLLKGHEGTNAAGHVIEAFGKVVIGGNFVVGLVVFVILMIINFVVVTKGAERISEVSARFTLDALPGKQMAIDADLNAGLINQEQAQARRRDVTTEADFYGAMDGASKFVRGDAIAGILILLINMLGGLAIGVFAHGLGFGEAFQRYGLLTIGDGLVAQIPSLLLAAASAVIVTRVSDSGDFEEQVGRQMLASPNVLYSGAAVMLILAIIPGMPWLPFSAFAGVLGYVAWRVAKRPPPEREETQIHALETALRESNAQDLGWDSISHVHPLGIRVGYRLVDLIDPAHGAPLRRRVDGMRRTMSESTGILVPPITVRDDLSLPSNHYAVHLHGVEIERAELHPDHLMAIPSPTTYGSVDGIPATDPAYGIPVTWIRPQDKAHAIGLGYQVVDGASVVATHVDKLLRDHLSELLTHDDVGSLLQRLGQVAPRLLEALEKAMPHTLIRKVCRVLLTDRVPLRNIVAIATTLLENAEATHDPILLAAEVRCALRREIVAGMVGHRRIVPVFNLAGELEGILLAAFNQAQQSAKAPLDNFAIAPDLLTNLQSALPGVQERMRTLGHAPILFVPPQLRPLLARYARVFAPGLHVLSYNEIPDERQIEIAGTLE